MDVKSLCIVLKATNYRENDKMLTLFSQDYGKIDALCRGCRKPGSSLLSSSDVLCCSEFAFNVKDDRYYVTQAQPKTNFYDIRKNMKALLTSLLFVEVCEKTIMNDEPNRRLFALLAGALHALANGAESRKVLIFFIYKLFDVLGVRPELDTCVICGKKATNRINILAGGAVCEVCDGEDVPDFYISTMKRIFETPSKNILTTELMTDEGLADLSTRWLQNQIGAELKSLMLL